MNVELEAALTNMKYLWPVWRPVRRGIRGEAQDDSKRDSKTFHVDRLFEAVASRDVRQLDGLYEYLRRNMKKLSDSLCESTHNASAVSRCGLLTCVLTPRTFARTYRSILR